MCRLFGFRSVVQSQVHRSLLDAENALGRQSAKHPDGWGVVYYVDGAPHLTRSTGTAMTDQLFHRLSGVMASETVLAHVRRASVGPISVLNSHPFQHGRWVFAHNGDVKAFERHRDALLALVTPRLRRYILGDTDSEVLFYLFLSHLEARSPLREDPGLTPVMDALVATVDAVRARCPEPGAEHTLTLLTTNGSTLAGIQSGRELYWATYKRRCPDRDHCASLAPQCEAPTATGFVNHLVVSSEPLSGENVWQAMQPGELVGVDAEMRLVHRQR